MQLPIANAKVSDLSKLHEQWNDFRIIPMAANLQMVFYKSKNKPILVKILYNEIEQTLPVPCGTIDERRETKDERTNLKVSQNCPAAPYYRWDDVREFYSALIKK
jgi:hypothetical protein